MVVSAALRNGHHSRVKNAFQISLAHKHIVMKMPMFGQRIHPCCFLAMLLLEDYICDGELALSAELKQ